MFADKPWLEFYESHVPEHIDYPCTVLPDVLRDSARAYPDHTAILYRGTRLSYQAFDEVVDRFAVELLQRLGLRKGDRVALHLPNCPQFPIAYYATLRAGGIVVPCNPLYQAHEMTHQLCDSGAKIIVTLADIYPLIKQIRAETELRHVIVANLDTYFPPELKEENDLDISGDADTHWFTDLVKGSADLQPVEVTWEDTAALMYTGGTTGISKGAQLTHKNILVNAYQCKVWINAAQGQEITLTQLPLFHVYGMTTCMNVSVLVAGAMILIPDPRDIADVLQTIDEFRPTLYPGVPVMYLAITERPDVAECYTHSIKACLSGAAGLPVGVQRRFQELTGARLVEGYGLTEASPVAIANPIFGQDRIGTIGLPWPDTEVKIVDLDTGEQELDMDEIGELCIRGPQVMKGYWNMPSETANALRPDPVGGAPWLYTGDIAMMDEDGYFQIVDRKKDMILGGSGYNVYPREIEDVLCTHPGVLEAAAVGIPVGTRGERVKAYVVLRAGQSTTEEELIAFCRENLAAYKVPRTIEFRDDLPKNIVGKVLRRVLAAEELKKQDWIAE